MDTDDPWDWPIDRVVQELCTPNRSWQPRTASMLIPDPAALDRVLREHEVDGNVLLLEVDDKVMRQDFGLKVLGRRAFIRGAIEELRLKSHKYQVHIQTHFNPSLVASQHVPSVAGFPQAVFQHGLDLALRQPQQLSISSHAHLGLQNLFLPQSPAATLSPHQDPFEWQSSDILVDSRITGDRFDKSDTTANKRRKLDPAHFTTDVEPQTEGISPRQITLAEESDISRNEESSSLQLLTSSTPDPNLKKRKRIIPTLISREDAITTNKPSTIEPGVVFIDKDGRKRLVPERLPANNSEEPYDYATLLRSRAPELQALDAGGEKSLAAAENILEVAGQKERAALTNSFAAGYLGKQKMPVDDIFYGDIEVGQDLSDTKEPAEFLEGPKNISSGRRLYVNSLMKHFMLRSEQQHFTRDGKLYSAIRPYAVGLALRYQNPSFTLYYSGENHRVRARRERLQTWPEVNPEPHIQQPQLNGDDDPTTYNPGPWESYGQDFDPDSLEKWNNISGGDKILPIYGESDEENEYDPETWREIEGERGELDRPLKPSKKLPLSAEEVDQAIDEGIAEMVVKWHRVKLPKNQRKAVRIWKRTRHHKPRRMHIESIREHLNRINNSRIPKIRKEIQSETWTSALHVRKQARIMEQSIFDRESCVWEMSIIESQTRPEKPPPKPSTTNKSAVSTEFGEEGESVGSDTEASSSHDDMDDFIDDDASYTDDEVELNLADSEDEEEEQEQVIALDFSSPSPSPPKNPLKGGVARKGHTLYPFESSLLDGQVVSNGNDETPSSDLFNGQASTPQSLISPCATSEGSQIKDENTLRKIPAVAPNNVSNMIDLTMTSSDEAPRLINLLTPKKGPTVIKIVNRNSPFRSSPSASPIIVSDEEQHPQLNTDSLPSLHDTAAVAKFTTHAWAKLKDSARLVITVLHSMEPGPRSMLFSFVSNITDIQLWSNMDSVMDAILNDNDSVKGMDSNSFITLVRLIRLFQMYTDCKKRSLETRPKGVIVQKLKNLRDRSFPAFYQLCSRFEEYFNKKLSNGRKLVDKGGDDEDEDEDEDEEPRSSIKRHRVNPSEEDNRGKHIPRKRARKNPVFEDANARSLRDHDRQRLQELEQRRQLLQSKLSSSGNYNSQHEIIINESKYDDQGFIYVNDQIARQIKPHQVEGVRFMWDQIVTDEKKMQGCLLAHTMGLGKTMQVITLLVAIAESSRSTDSTIYSQIPICLRASKTLILCPPGLIDNWMDELLTWSPPDVLGDFRKVDSVYSSPGTNVEKRLNTISAWYHDGGILVMGYEMFRNYIQNKKTKLKDAPLDPKQHEELTKYLLEGPNIIVADEAHRMKNADSGITKCAVQFRSKSRIALTGSPLANNVEEYHTMIDWVAPNYLGPAVEFRAKYVEPIQQGLWHDSDKSERRRSFKMLGVLRVDLAPKVHRADMSVLREDLPDKTEFVITVPLTDLQKKAYTIYVREMLDRGSYARTKDGDIVSTTIWHWLGVLSLLCNHPECFNKKLHERKEAAGKKDSSNKLPRDNSDQDEVVETDLNKPIWKVGVSPTLVNSVTELFNAEAPEIEAINLSNKVKVLCQILDASKAIGDKVLIFSQSIATLDYLEEMCKKQKRSVDRLDGKTKMSTRTKTTKAFNTSKTEIYLISTTAGGLGLNLFGANRVVIFDFKFNPILEEQAVGRAYRIGQVKPVFVYRFVAGGTFENSVHNKTVFKTQLASRVVDKKNPIAWASKKLSDFLFEPKPVDQTDLSEFKGKDPDVLDQILASQTEDSTICAIVETNTFERDDEDTLTLEEQKEVDQLVSDKQLERSDPKAYRAMMEKRVRQQAALPQPVLTPNGVQYQSGVENQVSIQPSVAQPLTDSAPMPASKHMLTTGPPQMNNSMTDNGVGSTVQLSTSIPSVPPAVITLKEAPTSQEMPNKTVSIQSPIPASPTIDRSAIVLPSGHGRSPIDETNTPIGSIAPEGRSPLSLRRGLARSAQNVSPAVERSRYTSVSPPGTNQSGRRYSRAIYEILRNVLIAMASEPEFSHLAFARNPNATAGRISADIWEILEKHTKDQASRETPYKALKAALQAAPEKCRALALSKSKTETFVLSFIEPPLAPNNLNVNAIDGIENTEMFKAMSRRPPIRQPPPRSLRDPVTVPRKKNHILEDRTRIDRLNQKRVIEHHSPVPKSATSSMSTSPSSTRIPNWAESEIREANRSHRRSNSRASSHTTTSQKD